MGQAEASGIVEAGRRELFYYTDWCYNVPEWFEPVRKTKILKLPDSTGMGKITHYEGILLGRDMDWEAESAEWKEDEVWAMRASRGMPAKMNLQIRFRFESVDAGRTKVTCSVGYRAPYPVLGPIIDRLYLQKEARRLTNLAIEGVRRMARKHRVHGVEAELEKREADHPGYRRQSSKTAAAVPARA